MCGHWECIPVGRMVIILSELIRLREKNKNIPKRFVVSAKALQHQTKVSQADESD